MARSLNKALLIGNLGADAEVRTTGAGTKVAGFSVATNRRAGRTATANGRSGPSGTGSWRGGAGGRRCGAPAAPLASGGCPDRYAAEEYDCLGPYDLRDLLDAQQTGVELPKPEHSVHRELSDAQVAR